MENILITKLYPDARMPENAYPDEDYPDVGWDMFAYETVTLQPGERDSVSTGIAIALPPATIDWVYEAQIRPRSGHRRAGILVTLGTIDSGYRGELGCIVYNLSKEPFRILKGHKICQLIVVKVPRVRFTLVEELPNNSIRGSRGFGSSGI